MLPEIIIRLRKSSQPLRVDLYPARYNLTLRQFVNLGNYTLLFPKSSKSLCEMSYNKLPSKETFA